MVEPDQDWAGLHNVIKYCTEVPNCIKPGTCCYHLPTQFKVTEWSPWSLTTKQCQVNSDLGCPCVVKLRYVIDAMLNADSIWRLLVLTLVPMAQIVAAWMTDIYTWLMCRPNHVRSSEIIILLYSSDSVTSTLEVPHGVGIRVKVQLCGLSRMHFPHGTQWMGITVILWPTSKVCFWGPFQWQWWCSPRAHQNVCVCGVAFGQHCSRSHSPALSCQHLFSWELMCNIAFASLHMYWGSGQTIVPHIIHSVIMIIRSDQSVHNLVNTCTYYHLVSCCEEINSRVAATHWAFKADFK